MAVQEFLIGDLEQNAIRILQTFCPPEGYWLAFSGGKDSVVLLDLAKRSGVKFEAHYSLTTIDPPEVVYFIRTFPEVQIDKPPASFLSLLPSKGFPTRQSRWCCEALKERGGDGRVVLTGVRAAESSNRAKRKMVEFSTRGLTKRFVHPIFFWDTPDVWRYIRERPLRYCSLYDEGWERLGCFCCPLARRRQRDIERWPKMARAFRRGFARLFATGRPSMSRWKTSDEMFDWWISDDRYPASETNNDCLFLG